jgi:glutaredoxin
MRIPMLFLIAIASAAVQAGTVYKWVDKQGSVHYTDHPPPKDATHVVEMQRHGGVVEVSKEPYETRVAAAKHPVTLFTAADCGTLCDQAREYLDNRGVPYSTRQPDKSPEDAEALKKLIGSLEVPVLAVGDKTQKGWDGNAWEKMLDGAGYPRSNPLARLKPKTESAPAEAVPPTGR